MNIFFSSYKQQSKRIRFLIVTDKRFLIQFRLNPGSRFVILRYQPERIDVLDSKGDVGEGQRHGGGLLAQLVDVVRLVEDDKGSVEVKVQGLARLLILNRK